MATHCAAQASGGALYAAVLERAVRIGLALLCLAYGIYIFCGDRLAYPPESIAHSWSLPPDTQAGAGPGIPGTGIPFLDWIPYGCVMFVAAASLVGMAVLAFGFARRKRLPSLGLAAAQIVVFLIAMSGAANRLLG